MFVRILQPGRIITFDYKNRRGEIAKRRVLVKELQHGYNEHYPDPQFLLHGWDLDKKQYRSFALANVVHDTMEIEV